MLSFCAICPHPPILLPTIGSIEDRKKVKKTISALEKLEKEFKETKTESLVVISPHGIINPDHFSITSAKDLFGDLFQFGDFSSFFEFKNDLSLVEEISKKTEEKNIPLKKYWIDRLDHGIIVPLYFLTKTLKPKIVPVGYSFLSRNDHFNFGKLLGEVIKESEKKIGVIASGDLSHRLTPDAPAGYSPQGEVFDKKIIELLKEGKTKEILDLPDDLIESAGECGYRSILIALGCISLFDKKFKFLSYEGPFGVGYLVGHWV